MHSMQPPLVWHLGTADGQCKDAARLWFGAKDCELVKLGNVLPVSVLDDLLAAHEQAQKAENDAQATQGTQTPTDDANAILDEAIKRAGPGTRNDTGFWLACRLRDSRLSIGEAMPIMDIYQMSLENTGSHPYTADEAAASVKQAYSRPPRRQGSEKLQLEIDLFEWWAWYGRLGNKKGDIHTSVKLVMAITDRMARAGSTQSVGLPVRSFTDAGIKKDTAQRHLATLVEANVLFREKKGNYRKATRYSLNVELLESLSRNAQPNPKRTGSETFSVEQSNAYKDLQHLAQFRPRARIDARLWPAEWDEPPTDVLGPAAHRMIAVLACNTELSEMASNSGSVADNAVSHNRGTDETDAGREGPTYCVTVSSVPLSLNSLKQWYTLSNVSKRKGRETYHSLRRLGIVTFEWGRDSRCKTPTLVEDWYEQLIELEPAFTTFGHDVLIANEYEGQRSQHHSFMGKRANQLDKEYHEEQTENAIDRRSENAVKLDELRRRRAAWCKVHGIEDVPIQLHPNPPKQRRKRTRVNDRDMGPADAVKKNRHMAHELKTGYDYRQALSEYSQLLSKGRSNGRRNNTPAQLSESTGPIGTRDTTNGVDLWLASHLSMAVWHCGSRTASKLLPL
jgi:hypothetical protein